ncbi:NAD-P-binding protein [Vararia minispora EC-137]|uniref:NAD-P-binding protein n=1 Tax=Vararia minispora EC-137 TaxID=1314806 RepID=A0ACB8QB84_9AGAM|nr:NAD-P-binding protein [Vararia minispora EC-137]
MSGNGIRTIALAGAGTLGSVIAGELLAAKASGDLDDVIILTGGSSDAASQYASQGARVELVDYKDEGSLTKALQGADAVISTLNAIVIGAFQLSLAKAAKSAGAKLFVPSDFGNNNDGQPEGLLAEKASYYALIEGLGLSWATFYTGLFADFALVPMFGFDFEKGLVTVGGDGSTPVSFTSRKDVARFVVYALTKFPFEQLRNKFLRIHASCKSFNEIVRIFEQKHGKKIETHYIPLVELEARMKKDPFDVFALLHHEWVKGRGAVGEPLDNEKWPEWNPAPVEEFL